MPISMKIYWYILKYGCRIVRMSNRFVIVGLNISIDVRNMDGKLVCGPNMMEEVEMDDKGVRNADCWEDDFSDLD